MSFLTSIFGGISGAHAAGTAANAQVGGDQEAAGTVTRASDLGNVGITTAAGTAGANAVAAGTAAAKDVKDTAAAGASGVTTAAGLANVGLNPYAQAGAGAANQLATGLAPGGSLAKTFTAADMEANDPGYQFRIDQGAQALERSAAAKGEVAGGGELKALTQYAQGTASSEYQNAFNRFTTNQQNNVKNLQDLSSSGLTAATTQGGNTTGAATYGAGLTTGAATTAANLNTNAVQYAGNADMTAAQVAAANSNRAAEYAGDTQMAAGDARATGIINKQNAYNGMLSGIGSTFDRIGNVVSGRMMTGKW